MPLAARANVLCGDEMALLPQDKLDALERQAADLTRRLEELRLERMRTQVSWSSDPESSSSVADNVVHPASLKLTQPHSSPIEGSLDPRQSLEQLWPRDQARLRLSRY